MRRLNLILLVVAAIVLSVMLRRIDWHTLMHHFLQAKRYWPLLFIPYGLTSFFWASSWRMLLAGVAGTPKIWRLFFVRLAGESLNQLTPTASLGGEPFKAVTLHSSGVAWDQAAASLVIHKALMVVSLVLYIFLALSLIPFALPGMSPALAWFSWLGALFLGSLAAIFVFVQRRNPCGALVRLLRRIGIYPAALRAREPALADLDAALAAYYRDHPKAGLLALLFFFLGWLVHAVEVSLIFWLLGQPIDFSLALCLDALSQLVAGLGFMIPASLGIQDGGNVLLSLGFNLGSTLGAGFSVLRRFREAFWLLLGLVVVAREK